MASAPIHSYPTRYPSPRKKHLADANAVPLLVWMMIVEAEQEANRHGGRILSDSDLVRRSLARIPLNGKETPPFAFQGRRSHYFRKEAGPRFREVVALRFRPGNLDQSAALTAQIKADASAHFATGLIEQIRCLPMTTELKPWRDLRWKLEAHCAGGLFSSEADVLCTTYTRDAVWLKRLLLLGRELFK